MGQMRIHSDSINAVTSSPRMPLAMSNQQQEIVWVHVAERMVLAISDFSRVGPVVNAWGSGVLLPSLPDIEVISKIHVNFMGTGSDYWFARVNKGKKKKKQTKKKTLPNPNQKLQPQDKNNSRKSGQLLILGIIYSLKSLHGGYSKTSQGPFWG